MILNKNRRVSSKLQGRQRFIKTEKVPNLKNPDKLDYVKTKKFCSSKDTIE